MIHPEASCTRRISWSRCAPSLRSRRIPSKLRERTFETSSGIPLKNSYTPADLADFDPLKDLGAPGKFPFTRHVQPSGYRGRLWTMRQYAGFATAEESNARYRYLLEQGTTGLSVAFDLPTQIGMDPDHPMALGEVGKVGVSISSIHDMRALFKDIPLDKVSTSMTINAPAAVLLALYLAVAEEQGVRLDQVSGTIQNDILKEYMARGTYIFPPRQSMRLITDIFAFCAEQVPELEHHLHLGLPHPRGGLHRGPGDRLHPGRRHRLRAGGPGRGPEAGGLRARGSASSSTPTTSSSRRWPSSVPRAVSGPGS